LDPGHEPNLINKNCSAKQHNSCKSAASFYRLMAAWVPDMFYNFYLVKKHKIAKNSTTTIARENISTHLESLEFWKFFDIRLTKFKNNQILLNKISRRFLLATKL
jgi:hypothetical protein